MLGYVRASKLTCVVYFVLFRTYHCQSVESTQYWQDDGHAWAEHLLAQAEQDTAPRLARNVIVFVGHGLSVDDTTAARGQESFKQKQEWRQRMFSFEKFESTGLMKIYNTKTYEGRTGGTATALACGFKNSGDSRSLSDQVKVGDCRAARREMGVVKCLGDWLDQNGVNMGVVSRIMLPMSVPSALVAHQPHVAWDHAGTRGGVPASKVRTGCRSTAEQMLLNYPGRNVKVYLGGQKRIFVNGDADSVAQWRELRENRGEKYSYVETKDELTNLNQNGSDFLLGLFGTGGYAHQYTPPNKDTVPTTLEMTSAALNNLAKREEQYFLLITALTTDWTSHENKVRQTLDGVQDNSNVISEILKVVDLNDTLLIYVEDQGQSLTMSGYQRRDRSLYGPIESDMDGNNYILAEDHLPYSSLIYSTGPGHGRNKDIRQLNTGWQNYTPQCVVRKRSSDHPAQDVAIYATGAMSHLFKGSYEQNVFPLLVAAALGLQRGEDVATEPTVTAMNKTKRSAREKSVPLAKREVETKEKDTVGVQSNHAPGDKQSSPDKHSTQLGENTILGMLARFLFKIVNRE